MPKSQVVFAKILCTSLTIKSFRGTTSVSTTKEVGQPTYNILRYIFLLTTVYALAITGFNLLSQELDIRLSLNSIVDVCKVVSMLSLVYVGGEMAWHREQFAELPITKGRKWFMRAAKGIFTISVVIFAVLLFKIVVSVLEIFGQPSDFPEYGKIVYSSMTVAVPFLALFPLFAYSLLNAILAFIPGRGVDNYSVKQKKAYYRSKQKGKQFFVYSNLSVVVPLLGIAVILTMGSFHSGISERDTFLSGAVAVVLMVSSICAKAVEEYSATA